MSDLVGNPEDRFSRVAAHFIVPEVPGDSYPRAIFYCEGQGQEQSFHYKNLPMQYTEMFSALKIENFQ